MLSISPGSKPTVVLDCDGLLSDFLGAAELVLHHMLREYCPMRNAPEWSPWQKYIPGDSAQAEFADMLGQRGVCAGMKPLVRAEQMTQLREIADVVVVTAPWPNSETWMSERSEWLYKHYQIDKIVHTADKEYVWANFFVDDKPENVRAWNARWGTGGYLWDTPQNQHATDLPRLLTWGALLALVRGPE